MRDLTTTEKVLLSLLSSALFQTEPVSPITLGDTVDTADAADMVNMENTTADNTAVENTDWRAVIKEASAQAVLLLAMNGHDEILDRLGKDDPQLGGRVSQMIAANLSNNLRVNYYHEKLHELMIRNHIPYVVLKGSASAYYYPEPLLRSMGDVDFLVSPDDLERAGQVLEAEGFTPWAEKHICHIVYRKPGVHLEMHFEPAGVPDGRAGELVREYMRDVFDTSVTTGVQVGTEGANTDGANKGSSVSTGDCVNTGAEVGTEARAEARTEESTGTLQLPDAFHHGLILLLHTCHHLTGEGVGLRHICDWAVFANSLSDEEFRELFEDKLRAVGLWRFAQLLTQLAIKYLGMPEKA